MRPTRLSRRELLRLGASGLLVAGLWPDTSRSADDFHFIAVNDTHLLNAKCVPWLTKAFKQMRDQPERPDFCLLIGDLTDQGTKEQLATVRDLLKEFGRPVYVVIGNHDHLTQTDCKPYEEFFPGRLNYHFEHRGWQFVGLDSTDGRRAEGTRVQGPALQWLDEQLPKLDKKRPTVLFTHFPLGAPMPSRPRNADDLLDRFQEFNLRAVYDGHYHGFTEKVIRGVPVTTNRCCSFSRSNHDGTKEKGYFLCRAKDGRIERTFVEVKPG